MTQISLVDVISELHETLLQSNRTVSVAESCTGGLLASWLTHFPGSSRYFNGAVISYSNSVKQNALAVPETLIAEHGAVSIQCAEAMCLGLKKAVPADICVSITGIAGPDGGTPEKPVGTVCFALYENSVETFIHHFSGTREEIREQAVFFAAALIRQAAEKNQ